MAKPNGMSEERVICAANWYPDLPTAHHRPKNCLTGIVFGGIGHASCLHQMVAMTGKKQHEVVEYQGFLTTHNRFLDRIEAARIALECGQIDELRYSHDQLYSEDLTKSYLS